MIARRLLAVLLAAIVLPVLPKPVWAGADVFDQPMIFILAENSRHDLQWIAAIGTITEDTPADFQKFTQAIKRKSMWIEFSSHGGNVVASLELGEMIRQRGYNTDVAFTILRGHGKDSLVPGYCYSACGYAFLGGVKRDVQEGSVLGYHQFYFDDPEVKLDAETDAAMTELLTHYIARYLQDMGIGARLLDIASATKPTDYYEPDSDELIELHIVTGHEEEAKQAPGTAAQTTLGKRSDAAPPGPDTPSVVRYA
jgi:hypothetical protein